MRDIRVYSLTFLPQFNFMIIYKHNANALSRHSCLAIKLGKPTYDHQKHALIGLDHLQLIVSNVSREPFDSSFLDSICTRICLDDLKQDILHHIVSNHVSRL